MEYTSCYIIVKIARDGLQLGKSVIFGCLVALPLFRESVAGLNYPTILPCLTFPKPHPSHNKPQLQKLHLPSKPHSLPRHPFNPPTNPNLIPRIQNRRQGRNSNCHRYPSKFSRPQQPCQLHPLRLLILRPK